MQLSIGRALLAGTAAGVVAAVVNAIVFATGAIDQSVETPAGGPITVAPVIVFSLIPNVIGGAVFWALRNTSAPIRLWRIVVVVVTIASFVPAFPLGAPTGMLLALLVMHVVAGIAAALVTPAVASAQPSTRG